jgi:hypothetical protein
VPPSYPAAKTFEPCPGIRTPRCSARSASAVRLALESNAANETSTPTTFVDLAETIWRLLGEDKTQQQVADELGWSREKIAQYAQLQKIDDRAWSIVTASGTDLTFGALLPGRNPAETLSSDGYHLFEFDH